MEYYDKPESDFPGLSEVPKVTAKRKHPLRLFLFVGIGLLLFVTVISALKCFVISGAPEVEANIQHFYDLYNAQDFEQIYSEAGVEMFSKTSKGEFLDFMRAVRRKLGKEISTERAGWQINRSLNGQTIFGQAQKTTFENGDGVETFSFKVVDGKPVMVGYNINSLALVLH